MMRIDMKKPNDQPTNPVFDLLRTEMARRRPATLDEANRIAAEVMERYNRTPQSELLGLSPEQAHVLTRPGWMGASLALNPRISLDDVAGAALFVNARRLLMAVKIQGVLKTTATGAFNRAVAKKMFEEFDISGPSRDMIRRVCKVLNQQDVPFLELLRHLLPQAGLLLYRKKEFRLTKRGHALIVDGAAGELYALLFRTLFIRINLAALDRLPEAPQVQNTIGFAFYQIGRSADDWIALSDLTSKVFLPAVQESLPELSWADSAHTYAELRVLRPLRDFGLVQFEREGYGPPPERVRKSALWDRFMQFNLPPSV